jgi:hypothetical protein
VENPPELERLIHRVLLITCNNLAVEVSQESANLVTDGQNQKIYEDDKS